LSVVPKNRRPEWPAQMLIEKETQHGSGTPGVFYLLQAAA
jgi:hypothetical protein